MACSGGFTTETKTGWNEPACEYSSHNMRTSLRQLFKLMGGKDDGDARALASGFLSAFDLFGSTAPEVELPDVDYYLDMTPLEGVSIYFRTVGERVRATMAVCPAQKHIEARPTFSAHVPA